MSRKEKDPLVESVKEVLQKLTEEDIDLHNIPTDTNLTIQLPKLISVKDYHEFREIENLLRELDLPANLVVEEVGNNGLMYFGLIHLNTSNHKFIANNIKRQPFGKNW